MLGAIMLLSLVMSAAIPTAFGSGGLIFAAAYVAIQVGRSLYVSWTMERDRPGAGRNLLRISLWFCASAPLWIGGAFRRTGRKPDRALAAGAADRLQRAVGVFPGAGLGRSTTPDWIVSGARTWRSGG